MKVFDSSAIYKAISSGQVKMLVGQCTSPLASYELGSIILKNSVIHKIYSSREAKELLGVCEIILEKMRIISPDLEDIYQVASKFHLSFYDASFVSLAIGQKTTLVTLDKKLAHKIHQDILVEEI